MKSRMTSTIALALCFLFLAACAPAAADAGIIPVTPERARYHYEHSALPRYFYEAPETMLDVMRETGPFRLWQALADENDVVYPYTEEDYKTYWYTAGSVTLLQIVMPKPEANTLCYRVYMLYDSQSGKAAYYTVEYENLLGESAMFCGWTADMTHANYGSTTLLDCDDAEALFGEASQVAAFAGVTEPLAAEEAS